MRGLALATLFLGLCLIDVRDDPDAAFHIRILRPIVFYSSVIAIAFGA